MKKFLKHCLSAALVMFGVVLSARAANVTVDVVQGETAALTTAASVYKNSTITFTVTTGTSRNQVQVSATETGTYGNSASKTAGSTAAQTVYVKGLAFAEGATVTTSSYKSSKNGASQTDTFTIRVAQADEMTFVLGDAAKAIATPTLSAAARWNYKVTEGADVVSVAMATTSATRQSVTVTPRKVGRAVIEIRSGSATSGSGTLRQRITVTVTPAPVDIFLAQSDTVWLYFGSAKSGTWNTSVNGRAVTGTDTVAGAYARFTRSVGTTAATAFEVLVAGRETSGEAVDQLVVTDPDGIPYLYRVHVSAGRLVELTDANPTVTLPAHTCNGTLARTWTASSTDAACATVALSPASGTVDSVAATITAKGVPADAAATTVALTVDGHATTGTGARGALYQLGVGIVKPRLVTLCEGDTAEIYYHTSQDRPWFLMVNGQLYAHGQPGLGDQMRITLESAGDADTDAILRATAVTVGTDPEASDLIIASDGVNLYPYRARVLPARVIPLGGTTNVVCASVTTANAWTADVDHESEGLISVDWTPKTPSAYTTATITGLQLADETYVTVRNNAYDPGSAGAQGGLYILKTKVFGAPTVTVNLSAGVGLDVAYGYAYGTDASRYSVELSGVGDSGVSYSGFATTDAKSFGLRLEAADTATVGATRDVTVKYGDETVITYHVVVQPRMMMAVGQVAPGFLYGSSTPWEVASDNPFVCEINPTVYNHLNSAAATAHKRGDCVCTATNATLALGYWGIAIRVHDVHETFIDLHKDESAMLRLQSFLDGMGWQVRDENEHLVTIDIQPFQPGASGPDESEGGAPETGSQTLWDVTIHAKGNDGIETFEIYNDYHVERVSVHISDGTKPCSRLAVPREIMVGSTQYMPDITSSTNWKAASGDDTKVVVAAEGGAFGVSASGSAGTKLQIKGVSVGRTVVAVELDNVFYLYEIDVIPASDTFETTAVDVGAELTQPLTGDRVQTTSVRSENPLIADVRLVGAGTANPQIVIIGVQEGQTTILIETPEKTYRLPVVVHQKVIYREIELVISHDGQTRSTYSYKYDGLDLGQFPPVNKDPSRLQVESMGDNTLRFTPLAVGTVEVDVFAYVDGVASKAEIRYTFHITKLANDEERVVNFDQGYLSYRGAEEPTTDADGNLVFVFTNVADVGSITIPDKYTALVDVLAVGGGGGGGTPPRFGQGGGGGGAGGMATLLDKKFTAGTLSFRVGEGGLGGEGQIAALGHGIPGLTGGPSAVTDAFGHAYLTALGGGGGGAPGKTGFNGLTGGSGGGGAWNGNTAGQGGFGTSGQGHAGGTPTVSGNGAGGGGAGTDGTATSATGAGVGGAGKTSAITCDAVYARGGDGGRNDTDAPAAKGANPGDGGAGGNGGPGGAGADGLVVVRVKKLYRNVLVPIPDDLVKGRFEWKEGADCAPFAHEGLTFRSPSNTHPYQWDDVIDHIVGTTNVVCTLEGEGENAKKVGIGYYNFTIYLKDGFAWYNGEDDEYGLTKGMRYMWTVVEDLENTDASISLEKSVFFTSGSNATVRIVSTSSPEVSGAGVPNVLFLGSLCNAHGFSQAVLKSALEAITAVGNVDYRLYNTVSATSPNNVTPAYEGSLKVGEKFTRDVTMKSGNHGSLYGFYKSLDEAIASGRQYDYVVFSFDRGLTATAFNGTYAGGKNTEAQIAAWLKTFYDNDAVIWLVDNRPENCTSPVSIKQTPWYPSQLVAVTQSSTTTWRSLYWYAKNYGPNSTVKGAPETWSFQAYKALMGLFDPAKYSTVSSSTYTQNSNYVADNANITAARVDALKGDAIENQEIYDNADKVATLISKVVKVKPYNLSLTDYIMPPAKGLTIESVTVQATSNIVDGVVSEKPEDWHDILTWDAKTGAYTFLKASALGAGITNAAMSVVGATNKVSVTMKGIDFPLQTRYDIHVVDDGTFRTSEDAEYNQSSGLFEKNPNNGKAYIEMVDNVGVGIGVDGEAETAVPWSFTAYPVTATAINGSVFVSGRDLRALSVYEGSDLVTYYRGNGGYKLSSISLDTDDVPLTADNAYEFWLRNIHAAHDIVVRYEPFYGETTSEPATNVYDQAAHVYPVELGDDWDPEFPTQIRYAISPDADEEDFLTAEEFIARYSEDPTQTQVGDHVYYYHVYAEQPGYGETLDQPGWVKIDGLEGSNVVTIVKRPVTITANSFDIYGTQTEMDKPALEDPTDYRGVRVDGLLGGDTANTNGTVALSCPDYSFSEGQYPIYPSTRAGYTEEDIVGPNYTIVYLPGAVSVKRVPMVIGDVTQYPGLDPENPLVDTGVDRVERVYDGDPTNLTVTVKVPDESVPTVIRYSTDEGGTWSETNPTFVHTGTNKVWYSVETVVPYEDTTYFFVTNYQYVIIHPRPLVVQSATATKVYDGNPLRAQSAWIVEGELVNGDTIAYDVTGQRTNVGTDPNTFTQTITSGDPGYDGNADYEVTRIEGALTVKVAPMNIGGQEQPTDPNFPLPYGETGVLSVEKTYDGEPSSITVNVVHPEDGYVLMYTTNRADASSWSPVNPAFTDSGAYTVYFSVVDPAGNYAAVTNFARVVIHPVEIVVKANDTGKPKGEPDPELTATVSGTIVEGDEIVYTLRREPGEDKGDYPIYAEGEAWQNNDNYHVTYLPGVFSIGEGQHTLSLWITDHEYSGEDTVYLAFQPRGSIGAITADYVKNLAARGCIKVRSALTEEDLATAELRPAELRDPNALLDLDKGWVWIKMSLPDPAHVKEPRLWEIVIDEPED